MNQSNLFFLKLGGSLITDKTRPLTPRIETIQRLATEIVQALRDNQTMQLLIGHGSGSFGHAVAERYKTQTNQIIYQHLSEAGLPIMAFPPSSGVIAAGKQIQSWDISALETALSHGVIPLVQGDVVFDTELGGTILSTETLFRHLAGFLHPGLTPNLAVRSSPPRHSFSTLQGFYILVGSYLLGWNRGSTLILKSRKKSFLTSLPHPLRKFCLLCQAPIPLM